MNKIYKTVLILLFISANIFGQNTLTIESKDKKINTEKLTGIWILNNMDEGKLMTPALKDLIKMTMMEIKKTSYFNFMKDGNYEMCIGSMISGVMEQGKWRISLDGKNILVKLDNYESEQTYEIKKLTKKECIILIDGGDHPVTFELLKGENSLNDAQKQAREKYLALYKDDKIKDQSESKEMKEKMIADSIAAFEEASKMAKELMLQDSMDKANGIAQKEKEPMGDCLTLELLIQNLREGSSTMKGEFISKTNHESYYKCIINFDSTKRIYYTYNDDSPKPKEFHWYHGENLSEKEASDLFDKKLKEYQDCKKSKWTEVKHGKGKWDYIEDKSTLVSLQLNYDDEKKKYEVVFYMKGI